jgi:hypothetical protein
MVALVTQALQFLAGPEIVSQFDAKNRHSKARALLSLSKDRELATHRCRPANARSKPVLVDSGPALLAVPE